MQGRILEVLNVCDGRNIVTDGLITEDVARAAGLSRPTASKWLAIMEVEGLVTHYDIGRSKFWFRVEKVKN